MLRYDENGSEGGEFNISQSEDTSDLSSDYIYSETSESEDDDMDSLNMWVKQKKECFAPPPFNFTRNPNKIDLINVASDFFLI